MYEEQLEEAKKKNLQPPKSVEQHRLKTLRLFHLEISSKLHRRNE